MLTTLDLTLVHSRVVVFFLVVLASLFATLTTFLIVVTSIVLPLVLQITFALFTLRLVILDGGVKLTSFFTDLNNCNAVIVHLIEEAN